jgi:hypothetical protein
VREGEGGRGRDGNGERIRDKRKGELEKGGREG